MDERFRNAPVGILDVAPDGTVRAANPVARDLLNVDRSVDGEAIDAVFPESVDAHVPRAFETPPETEQSFDEYYPGLDRFLSVSLVPYDDGVYLYLRDETAENRYEQRLAATREDVDRLTITNELIAEVLADLVAASTRAEIAETICSRLGETDIYEFAWVGEREIGSDDVSMRAAAGTTNRTFERIEAELDGDGAVPELRAVERGEPDVVQPLGDDESVPEAIRRAAFADGLQSLLAVPLTYGSSVYGVVGIYASNRDVFSERERENFGTVGEMAGFAINATRHRSLLLSDTVVELAFEVGDPATPFVAAATELNAELSVIGLVPERGHVLCDLDVTDTPPDAVERTLTVMDSVDATRVVAAHDDGGSIEVTVADTTPLGRLLSQGATLQSATYDETGGRIVVELPPDEDIHRIADAFTRQYDAEVVAKRERQRDAMTAREFRDALSDRLTDRQETVLRTAFFADYFQSPRGSSAEEVAETLGITGPTLLHHLRAGQRKLLEEFFETEHS